LAAALEGAAPTLDAMDERIALAMYRTLAEGQPAAPAVISSRAGVAQERVDEFLTSWPSVFRDQEGGVLGFGGLTIARLRPTHRLEIDGRELFGWCAWDTLFLPWILDATARVGSDCPVTRETISLLVSPTAIIETSHPNVVVSFLLPDRQFDDNVIQSFCHFVHFFASPEAGQAWVADHPGTFLLSLEDAFELGRRWNELRFPSSSEAAG